MTAEAPFARLWTAGEELNKEAFNEVGGLLKFMLNPPEIWVRQTTAQSIANNTWTAMNYDTVVKDNYANFAGADPHWAIGAPSVITIQVPGWYEVMIATHWTASATITQRIHALRINNVASAPDYRARHDRVGATNGTSAVNRRYVSNYDLFLTTGDTVNVMVLHNVGAALSTAVGGPYSEVQLKWHTLSGKYTS